MSRVVGYIKRPVNKSSIGSRKPLRGVGINDAEYMVGMKVDGKTLICPIYARWSAVLSRCYDKRYTVDLPTYSKCTIAEEWKTFSNFSRWMEQQDWQGKALDKDILVKGNKCYSPSTAAFVLPSTNALVLDSAAIRGKYLIGVSYCKRTKRYQTLINVKGKGKGLGRFPTEAEAHNVWRLAKSKQLYNAANNEVDVRVQEALRARAAELSILIG